MIADDPGNQRLGQCSVKSSKLHIARKSHHLVAALSTSKQAPIVSSGLGYYGVLLCKQDVVCGSLGHPASLAKNQE